MILYTDIDEFCCKWLESLIENGLLPKGDVLCEDIKKINPESVRKYTQRHWCCGIGGWPYALQLAGWPVDRPVDTASLPCQPFSIAGKQQGENDERHLWPTFRQTVSVLRPTTIFGEQVPQAIRLGWLDGIFSDLERENYACGAVVLPSCSVNSPNIRQRLWWLAHSKRHGGRPDEPGREEERRASSWWDGKRIDRLADPMSTGRTPRRAEAGNGQTSGGGGFDRLAETQNPDRRTGERGEEAETREDEKRGRGPSGCCSDGGMGITNGTRSQPGSETSERNGYRSAVESAGFRFDRMENPIKPGLEGYPGDGGQDAGLVGRQGNDQRRSASGTGFWDRYQLIQCRDGKQRRIPEPQSQFQFMVARLSDILGSDWLSDSFENEDQVQGFLKSYREILGDMISCFPLARKIPGSVGVLKGAGNAINPYTSALFIKAAMEVIGNG
jgi:DNA (cytosine-5)-methyltransferase 1